MFNKILYHIVQLKITGNNSGKFLMIWLNFQALWQSNETAVALSEIWSPQMN